MKINGLYLTGLIVQFRLLVQFENALEFLISELDVLTRFLIFFLGGVTARDVVKQGKLEIEILFGGGLADDPITILIDFIGAVYF